MGSSSPPPARPGQQIGTPAASRAPQPSRSGRQYATPKPRPGAAPLRCTGEPGGPGWFRTACLRVLDAVWPQSRQGSLRPVCPQGALSPLCSRAAADALAGAGACLEPREPCRAAPQAPPPPLDSSPPAARRRRRPAGSAPAAAAARPAQWAALACAARLDAPLAARGISGSAAWQADVTVEVPSMGESITEGSVAVILKKPGALAYEPAPLTRMAAAGCPAGGVHSRLLPGLRAALHGWRPARS